MLLGFFSVPREVTLPATYTALATNADPGSCRADFVLQADGDYGKRINNVGTTQGSFTDEGDWLDNIIGMVSTLYEYNISLSSGTSPSGTAIHADAVTWTTMPSSGEINWYLTQSGDGTTTCDLDLQIREIANIANIDTSVVTITAFVTP